MKYKIYLLFVIVLFGSTQIMCQKTAYYEQYINKGWMLESSDKIKTTGDLLSLHNFAQANWKYVNIPSTVLSGLRQNDQYKDIYFSDNLDKISKEQFNQSWWFRKEFEISDYGKDQFYELQFEGLNYKANIWLNGKLIASSDSIEGPFRLFNIDVTHFVGTKNVLAVEVFPPQKSDLTIGFVDWNPNTPDKNMGMWRGVKLKQSGKVSLENIAITSKINLKDYSEADLTIRAELKNHASVPVQGKLKTTIEGGIAFEISYQLNPQEIKTIVLDKNNASALKIKNPRLWWVTGMGKPELYNAEFSVYTDNLLSHVKKERFGIRQISDYTFNIGKDVHRGYLINGKKVLIKGGGWVDDMCLADNDEKVRSQVEYVKSMNLNTIRFEGFWTNSQELYRACDENGILLMIGLSCQWEWESYCGRKESDFMCVETDHDMKSVAQSFQDQVKWGMNNPSIFLWVYGSDKLPNATFEKLLNSYVKKYDIDRCVLTSCKNRMSISDYEYQTSTVSGNSGSKMLGPYDYVAPIYWYEDEMMGGAYGFNTETGPGPQIPPIESLRKMLTPEELPLINGKGWQYHCGRNEFNTLDRFLNGYEKRYWKDNNVEDFAFNVQLSNYEAIRPMYESFIVNRNTKATGVVQWMLNASWPKMFWQLYDWYLNPNGAFYGTKAACQPVNLIYNYLDKKIYLSNETQTNTKLTASVKVFDIHSTLIYEKKLAVNAEGLSVNALKDLPPIVAPSDVYFLSLNLYNEKNEEIATNFYWLSNKSDVMDYKKSQWYYTPQKEYASFAALNNLPKVKIESECRFNKQGEKNIASVILRNNSKQLAFFIEMRIVDEKTQQTILPVFWSDNYASLLPGETKTFKAEFSGNVQMPQFIYKGFNTEK